MISWQADKQTDQSTNIRTDRVIPCYASNKVYVKQLQVQPNIHNTRTYRQKPNFIFSLIKLQHFTVKDVELLKLRYFCATDKLLQ